MGRIVEYKIIAHGRAKDIDSEVTSYLAKGWELYGELIAWGAGGGLAQAMVRRESS